MSLTTILIIILLFILIGALPNWPHAQNWQFGYWPSGAAGLVILILVILFFLGPRS